VQTRPFPAGHAPTALPSAARKLGRAYVHEAECQVWAFAEPLRPATTSNARAPSRKATSGT